MYLCMSDNEHGKAVNALLLSDSVRKDDIETIWAGKSEILFCLS